MLYLYMRCRIDISFFICKLKSETLGKEKFDGIDDDDSDDSGGIYFSNGGVVSLSIYHN